MDSRNPGPEGITSLLDTDLYKLTMQCAVLRQYPSVDCTYAFTNRTPDLKLTRKGFEWLQAQVSNLGSLKLAESEREFLEQKCPYLPQDYLSFLQAFRFSPAEQVKLRFELVHDESKRAELQGKRQIPVGEEFGDLTIEVSGKWVETILYEIPLLVLVSECYFRFSNTDWNHEGQEERAFEKGKRLLENNCTFSEFGTRRRRDYHTQDLVLRGLIRASQTSTTGTFTGTSNVHFAHRHNLTPIGTVAHEWFMGVAAVTQSYTTANELGLRDWVRCFGPHTLAIALTDTFGTRQFLHNFSQRYPHLDPPQTYAQLFAGVRQDSGDPAEFVALMKEYYTSQNIPSAEKIIVFSDSLDIDKCIEYKRIAEAEGFRTSFGVGTFLTNDFYHLEGAGKSVPLNIVIKISSASGRPAVKISDNQGKNTGDPKEVERVKRELGYVEREWEAGDEGNRWGGKNE